MILIFLLLVKYTFQQVLSNDASGLHQILAMSNPSFLQQQLLPGTENLLPLGVQNLVTLAAMSQPTPPLCMAASILGKTAEVNRGLTSSLQPNLAAATDLGYGSLFSNATMSTAAANAAGKQVEGECFNFLKLLFKLSKETFLHTTSV